MGILSRARLTSIKREGKQQAAGGLAGTELAVLLGDDSRQQERTKGMTRNKEKLCGISVDSYRCNACGGCVELCPEHFVMDDADGTAREIHSRAKRRRDLEEAAAFCPRKCIELIDEK